MIGEELLQCPVCGETMRRRGVMLRGRTTGLTVVDICNAHGIWIDADELDDLVDTALGIRRTE